MSWSSPSPYVLPTRGSQLQERISASLREQLAKRKRLRLNVTNQTCAHHFVEVAECPGVPAGATEQEAVQAGPHPRPMRTGLLRISLNSLHFRRQRSTFPFLGRHERHCSLILAGPSYVGLGGKITQFNSAWQHDVTPVPGERHPGPFAERACVVIPSRSTSDMSTARKGPSCDASSETASITNVQRQRRLLGCLMPLHEAEHRAGGHTIPNGLVVVWGNRQYVIWPVVEAAWRHGC